MTTTTRRRSPATHRITGPANHRYPLWTDNATAGTWTCDCGATGEDQATAEEHLRTKAKAAFKRLDDQTAFITAALTESKRGNTEALGLLTFTRRWHHNPALRRHMTPFYDGWGLLSAALDWTAVAADLADGTITGDASDLLVLRVAISLAGVEVPLRLSDLPKLPHPTIRHVRDALNKQIRLDEDQA